MPTDWLSQSARKIGDAFGARRDLLLPAAVLGLLVVLVVPLPAAILDLLLVANIAIASLMLINAFHIALRAWRGALERRAQGSEVTASDGLSQHRKTTR